MNRLVINRIKCKRCGDVIESKYTHDFKWCKCGSVAVDGGHDYAKRTSKNGEYIDLSVWEKFKE